ncbi:uncharacterized protein L201_000792 [Kwoniella dendrophila CBS 6074]|uniref:Uncharacterized protein n=1 Tax=Kwoniella dendrophila CBS 6074 TaxID=1295534 RepID=A0AAX4JKJ2_9TREE
MKIHSFHQYGNVKLTSKDDIVLMADSRRLYDASGNLVFCYRDHDKTYEEDMKEWSAASISLFLDMISVNQPQEPKADLISIFELADICRTCESPTNYRQLVKNAMIPKSVKKNCQWALLLHATHDEDEAFFKSSLRHMKQEAFLFPIIFDRENREFKSVSLWEAINAANPYWHDDLRKLVQSVLILPDQRTGPFVITTTADWKKVADEFDYRQS